MVIHGYEEKRVGKGEGSGEDGHGTHWWGIGSRFRKAGSLLFRPAVRPSTKKAKPGWLLYDSKDLVTHAVCVGMTGSGKTGLCIGLLEEAAIDNIPAIVIDPKGDIANLL